MPNYNSPGTRFLQGFNILKIAIVINHKKLTLISIQKIKIKKSLSILGFLTHSDNLTSIFIFFIN